MQPLQISVTILTAFICFLQVGTGSAQSIQEVVMDTIPGTDVYFSMIPVPGGIFQIGTPNEELDRGEDEGPQQTITLAPFYIGAHEVTYDEFRLFSSLESDTPEGAPGVQFDPALIARPSPPYEDPAHGMGTAGYPAVGMTQWGALQYARWLSIKTGKFYRLPTEAEWEIACRAGTSSAYSFGNQSDSLDIMLGIMATVMSLFKK